MFEIILNPGCFLGREIKIWIGQERGGNNEKKGACCVEYLDELLSMGFPTKTRFSSKLS